ncbi:immunoglobulin superfamily member 10, partial [Biomphalaria glabrata]
MQAKHYLVFQFVFIWQYIVSSQGPNAIFRLENTNVKMTIKITPNVSQPVTTIRLDRRDGSPTEIVAFIYLGDFGYEIQTAYSERLSLTTSAQERIVALFMSGLRPSDAGMYQCWDGALQATIIENCGQKLIIVRKPNQPIIFSLTKALKGNTLELSCNASSTSLPADHGLKQAIVWRDELNTIIGIPAGEKFVVNPNSQLEIRNLEHSDIGRQLTCTSSEKAEGLATTPVSEPSLPYQIRLEGAPSEKDVRLTPPIRNKAKIIRREQERLSYNCSAECEPHCTVQWTFETLNSQTPLNLSDPGVLKLRVKQEDHGVYRCIAKNTFGEASKEFKLEVQYIHKPVLFGSGPVPDKSCIEVKETAKLSLTCLVDALPEPEISWKSPDDKELSAVASRPYLLDNDFPNNHSLQLLLKSVQLEDSGGYICEASNAVDFVYAMVNISVVGPPSVVNMYGLQLYPVYFRDFRQNVSLNISFVVKSVTEPSVESVTSKRIDS